MLSDDIAINAMCGKLVALIKKQYTYLTGIKIPQDSVNENTRNIKIL